MMTRNKPASKSASGNNAMTEQAAKKINGSSSATFSQCSCSWKDDMIRFYREESITAWVSAVMYFISLFSIFTMARNMH